jgi:hypothetical protein
MSTDDRIQALRAAFPAGADPVLLAGLADLEARAAAALALYVQGTPAALDHLLGPAAAEPIIALPIAAAFAAAAAAITAAVGDDPTRGYAALATLQERAAEYQAAHDQLNSRPTEGNAG